MELDRMDPDLPTGPVVQSDLDVNRSWTDLASRKLTDRDADFKKLITPNGVLSQGKKDLWKGADLNPAASAGADFRVQKNEKTTLTTESVDMCNAVPAGYCENTPPDAADRSYYLRDDKLSSLAAAVHDTSLLETILQEVYVRVDGQPAPPFRLFNRNLETPVLDAMTGAATNSLAYWNVPLLLAFEQSRADDHDPSETEGLTSGQCGRSAQPVAAVFLEGIRDFDSTNTTCRRSTVPLDEYIRGTAAHEVLHGLTLGHDGDQSGALMCCA